MSVGEFAALLAAVAFVALVALLAVPIIRLGQTVDQCTRAVRDLRQGPVSRTAATVDETNELLASTNAQLQRVDAITANAQTVTTNVAAMSALFSATLGGPLVRTAAFTYGVRRAIAGRRDARNNRRAGRL
ncbi:DUF948 domain-containing protein [Haloactinopolyspora sp.]|uniref:DUF948 domain-containing protein n=1 Tax=Haloactinopolyspora sp. TaxID=1966353 RepID=UPI002617E7A4|nr:DUF948 domain-containing protein [Haloactinopolyspora sp.]